jgi:hypothetical protein
VTKRTGAKRGTPAGRRNDAQLEFINSIWTATGLAPLDHAWARRRQLIASIKDHMPVIDEGSPREGRPRRLVDRGALVLNIERVQRELMEQLQRPVTRNDAIKAFLTDYAVSTGRDPQAVMAAEFATWKKEVSNAYKLLKTIQPAEATSAARANLPEELLDELLQAHELARDDLSDAAQDRLAAITKRAAEDINGRAPEAATNRWLQTETAGDKSKKGAR